MFGKKFIWDNKHPQPMRKVGVSGARMVEYNPLSEPEDGLESKH